MQSLHEADLVKSTMGAHGGFSLVLDPSKVSLLDIIEAVQGSISINKCIIGLEGCDRSAMCPVSYKMKELQFKMEEFLGNVTLSELLKDAKSLKKKKKSKKPKGKK